MKRDVGGGSLVESLRCSTQIHIENMRIAHVYIVCEILYIMLLDLNKNFYHGQLAVSYDWFECARLCGLPATVRFDWFE